MVVDDGCVRDLGMKFVGTYSGRIVTNGKLVLFNEINARRMYLSRGVRDCLKWLILRELLNLRYWLQVSG